MGTAELATFVVFGLLSPVLAWLAGLLIDRIQVSKAHKRLDEEELVFEGSRFRKLMCPAGSSLMGEGEITSLEPGRVLVTSKDGERMTFSGQEFETMHPVWLKENAASLNGAPLAPPTPSGTGDREVWS